MENKNTNYPTEAEINASYDEILTEVRRADARLHFAQYVGIDPATPVLDSKNQSAVNSFVERFKKNPLRMYLDNGFIDTCFGLFLAKSPNFAERDSVWEAVFDNLASTRFEVAVN